MGFFSPCADVFVIGGGPAGLAAAIAARRRGLRVTVADAAVPPIDKACGEGIMPDGVAAARALGIHLEDAGAQPFPGIRFCEDGRSVTADFPRGQAGLALRRTALHALLVECASAAGVKLMWGAAIREIADLPARWVIGADGGHSRVRHWAGIEESRRNHRRYGFRRQYRVAPWTPYMELHWSDDCQLYITPLGAGEICVALISSDPALRLDLALPRFPAVMRRVAGAPATSERGGISADRRLEHVTRGRVALIGDASGSVDAITGEGICLLFRQAAALAESLETDDMRTYEAAHRRICRRPGLMADLMLLLDGHRRLRHRVLRALASHPQHFRRMLEMHVGDASPFAFLSNGLALGWHMLTS